MEKYKRKAVLEKLNVFYPISDDSDYIEVTEWHNGEGWDINIYNKNGGDRSFSLSYGEFEALQYCIDTITHYSNEF